MSEPFEFVVCVGKDKTTGKYHAYYYEPDGMRMTGPARDTPLEASKDGEEVLYNATKLFDEAGFIVKPLPRKLVQ